MLDLCTGSGCLAILAALLSRCRRRCRRSSPRARSRWRARNVGDHGLDDRITLHRGDLFAPLGGTTLRPDHHQPALCRCRRHGALPPECRARAALAFDGGADGLDLVRRILREAPDHLTPDGGLLCEIGRGRELVDEAFPELPLLWLDTEESEGEVFWIAAADLG